MTEPVMAGEAVSITERSDSHSYYQEDDPSDRLTNSHAPRLERIQYSAHELFNALESLTEERQMTVWTTIQSQAASSLHEISGMAVELSGHEPWAAGSSSSRKKKGGKKKQNRNSEMEGTAIPNPGSTLEASSNGQTRRLRKAEVWLGMSSASCEEELFTDGANELVDELEAANEDGDSDEEGTFQFKVFEVTGEPNFEAGPPTDGFEFLRRVQYERKRCPKTVVAKIDPEIVEKKQQTSYMPSLPEIATCPAYLLPTKEWEDNFLSQFSDLRENFSTLEVPEFPPADLPPAGNLTWWHTFCFGSKNKEPLTPELKGDQPPEEDALSLEALSLDDDHPNDDVFVPLGSQLAADINEELDDNSVIGNGHSPAVDATTLEPSLDAEESKRNLPTLSLILRLDDMSRSALLRHHANWLEKCSNLSFERGLWIFSLSVVVGKPLDSYTMAAFRSMFRKCCSIRAEKEVEDDELAWLNILILISGRYFGQGGDVL